MACVRRVLTNQEYVEGNVASVHFPERSSTNSSDEDRQ